MDPLLVSEMTWLMLNWILSLHDIYTCQDHKTFPNKDIRSKCPQYCRCQHLVDPHIIITASLFVLILIQLRSIGYCVVARLHLLFHMHIACISKKRTLSKQ